MALFGRTAASAATHPGVVPQTLLSERDFARMDRGGVRTVRTLVRWRTVEPSQGEFDWTLTDQLIRSASEHGLEVLPFVYGSPSWVSTDERRPPLGSADRRAAWRAFLTQLVERYGPGGTFTRTTSSSPVDRWQIWNEPNFEFYWSPAPSPTGYMRLLRISARAIRAVDPKAEILTAGLPPIRSGIPWWDFLESMYSTPHAKAAFDTLAIHPYSENVADLKRQLEMAREVMVEHGDEKTPLAVTEIGWSSGSPRQRMVVGERRQAENLTRSFAVAATPQYRVSDILWYTWRDSMITEPFCPFCPEAGLFGFGDRPKPSWAAFQLASRKLAR